MRRLSDDPVAVKARERVAARRQRTDYAYDRAYNRALRRLVEEHRQEFGRLLDEERNRV